MSRPPAIETKRLRLRNFRADERARFADLTGDPEVGVWLGGVLTRRESDAAFDRVRADIDRRGYGLWAVERLGDGALIGQIGLNPVPRDLPVAPAIEMSWRMFPEVWGQGYATEGAAAALGWGLTNLPVTAEIVAFTTPANQRSRAIMRRIGLARDHARDFEHPRLPLGHPLRAHIVYAAKRPA
jgi:RimJ/RimL family protein N-acetyltransferase